VEITIIVVALRIFSDNSEDIHIKIKERGEKKICLTSTKIKC
jgi:hypothetical protein